MAVDRVEKLLRKIARALNRAKIDYAVIGGNAVAAWVATVDEGAVRATKDVDLLIRRNDLPRTIEALRPLGLVSIDVLGVQMFVDRLRPNPKTGAHVVFGGERIRPHYRHPAPDPSHAATCGDGFRLIDLAPLVAMKLQADRPIDQAHLQDLHSVGLIGKRVRNFLPADLRGKLNQLLARDSDA